MEIQRQFCGLMLQMPSYSCSHQLFLPIWHNGWTLPFLCLGLLKPTSIYVKEYSALAIPFLILFSAIIPPPTKWRQANSLKSPMFDSPSPLIILTNHPICMLIPLQCALDLAIAKGASSWLTNRCLEEHALHHISQLLIPLLYIMGGLLSAQLIVLVGFLLQLNMHCHVPRVVYLRFGTTRSETLR